MRPLKIVLTTTLYLSAVMPLNACIVRHMNYQQALAETDSTVLGEIVEISPSREGQLSRSFNYRIKVMQSGRGRIKVGAIIDVELLLDLARNQNGVIMCPLQRGSGTENALELGKRYRMLIKKEGDAFELYWGDSLQPPPRNH